jgi:2,3-bisphosphoglycerate-dependent phosphoglycerate mutase
MRLRPAHRAPGRRTARGPGRSIPDQPYPGRESWRQAVTRVGWFLDGLPLHWNGQRVLVIGHVATRRGLDHFVGGVQLEQLAVRDFAWQEGWEYRLS